MEGARHYAVALGAGAFKPRTVGDLVRAIAVAAPRAARASTAGGRDSSTGTSTRRDVPVAIACAARDGVDEVAVACAEFGVIRTLHADQDADERRGVLAACARSARRGAFDDDDDDGPVDDDDDVRDDGARCVCVVTTDACLPSAANGEASLGFPLLVNYDVPRTKEAYARRARVALGGGGRGGGEGVVVTLIVADDETLSEVCGDREVEMMPVDVLEEVARGWFRRANGPDA